jgi:hypothetical protein
MVAQALPERYAGLRAREPLMFYQIAQDFNVKKLILNPEQIQITKIQNICLLELSLRVRL